MILNDGHHGNLQLAAEQTNASRFNASAGYNQTLRPSLVSEQPLDFEKKHQFGLRLQVENVHINPRFFSVGPFRDEASVKITVEDVDEPPVFERPSYIMEVKEDATRNAVIGSVSASDLDDKRSPIRYGSLQLAC